MKKKNDFWISLCGAILLLCVIILLVIFLASKEESATPITDEPASTIDDYDFTDVSDDATEPVDDSSSNDSSSSSDSTEKPGPEEPESTPNSAPSQPYTQPSTTAICYHEEGGRCWDDIEDEAYSAGLYDGQFGYYGATLEYAEDCNALCREIIEDAYDEGYADSR